MVAVQVGQLRGAQAAVVGGHLQFGHLGRTGLAAHVGIVAAHHLGGAAPGRAAHGLDHEAQMAQLGGDAAAHLAGGIFQQLGLEQVAAVEHGRHIDGHLDGRDQGEALTDGGVERIAAHPDLLAVALLPVTRGHQARTLVGQVHPGGAAEAALLGKGRDLVDA